MKEKWTNRVVTIIIPADLTDDVWLEGIIEAAGDNAVLTDVEEESE